MMLSLAARWMEAKEAENKAIEARREAEDAMVKALNNGG